MIGAMVYLETPSQSHLEASDEQADKAEREHQQNGDTWLVALAVPLAEALQKREHAITRQGLQHARAANERAQRGGESHDEDAHHGDVRREPHVLEDVRVLHQRVVREHERGERVQQRVVRQRRADGEDRAATQVAAGVLEVSREVGALHDARHGGEDHGEHRAERGGRQRRRKEVLFEGGEGEPCEKTAVTELLGMRRRGRERERT